MFAGTFAGDVVDRSTRIALTPAAEWRTASAVDSGVLMRLVDRWTPTAPPSLKLRVRANDCLYVRGGTYYYVEALGSSEHRRYALARCEATPEARLVVEGASAPVAVGALVSTLVSAGASFDDARRYVGDTIQAGLLQNADQPPLMADESPSSTLLSLVRENGTPAEAASYQALEQHLADADSSGALKGVDFFSTCHRLLEALGVEAPIARAIQVDLIAKPTIAQLARHDVEQLTHAVDVLERLLPQQLADPLAGFRQRFVERYERRAVPLLEALDPESGLGSALVSDHGTMSAEVLPADIRRTALLADMVTAVARKGERVLVLDSGKQHALSGAAPRIECPARCVVASLGWEKENGTVLRLQYASGPGSVRPLARFARGDAQLRIRIVEQLRIEEAVDPETITAEVTHWPTGRMRNILQRPQCHAHEIALLCAPGVAADRLIPLSDLTLQVVDGLFVLRSSQRNRTIRPRLTTAHNYSHPDNLPVYRLLGLLQSQGHAEAVWWDWGGLRTAPWLPRVQVDNVVVAREQWHIKPDDLGELRRAATVHDRYEAMRRLQARLQLPQHVALTRADNELFIDLENVVAVECLCGELLNGKGASLVEVCPGIGDAAAVAAGARHVLEVMVPVTRQRRSRAVPTRIRTFAARRSRTSYVPGFGWLTLKLYGGSAITYGVLRDVVWPDIEKAIEAQELSGFFWLHYRDTDHHLRVRVKGVGAATLQWYGRVMPQLQSLLQQDALTRVQVDSYEPEVERYGGAKSCAIAETLFEASSRYALRAYESRESGQHVGTDGILRAVVSTDTLLGALMPDVARRQVVLATCTSGTPVEIRQRANAMARTSRHYLEEHLGDVAPGRWRAASGASSNASPAVDVTMLAQFEESLLQPAAALSECIRDQQDEGATAEMIGSIVHMHLNRALGSVERTNEMLVYEVLSRYYSSQLLRKR
jgi:thiopeptide-type bacteriocin biosynthesis protein